MRVTDEVTALIAAQSGVVSVRQLRACGLSDRDIRRGEAYGWRFVLPGVVCVGGTELATGQRLVAARLYAGDGALLASVTAAAWHGVLGAAGRRAVHVLVPAARKPPSTGFVVVRRTTRPDRQPWSRGPLQICSRARAVVDAARDADNLDHARDMMIEAVQRGLVRTGDLRHELEAGSVRGSRWIRQALADAEVGAWSLPEADLVRVVGGSTVLPVAWPNPRLRTSSGTRLPIPDLWFDDVGLAVQVHSRRHHLLGADWEDTVMQDSVFAAFGIPVVAVTPARIARDPRGVRALIERAYLAARRRPRPDVVMLPRDRAG